MAPFLLGQYMEYACMYIYICQQALEFLAQNNYILLNLFYNLFNIKILMSMIIKYMFNIIEINKKFKMGMVKKLLYSQL